jgi:adenine-specific DNA methylase
MANKKKVIEVALLLDAINKVSAREKSIRNGYLCCASDVFLYLRTRFPYDLARWRRR